ncbi:hypothetical protein HHI36_020346 [Cryptolaemus montrouzieri]|uniref:Uncharacterized protein n=1 Tax=Cryptolaemus montrouzieri TaxID=559131 RepID=A0ABD2NBM6_9CUCU
MDSDFFVSSEEEIGRSSRGMKKTGRVRDVMNTLRATTHELGPDYQCEQFHCFTSICEPERRRIIREFNDLGDANAQNAYLAGLITILLVMRRRPRKNEDEARINTASFSYRGRISENEKNPRCNSLYEGFHILTRNTHFNSAN